MPLQKYKVLASCCALAFALGTAVASAEPVKWDFSDEYGANPNDFTIQAAQYCIAEVEKRAGDDLDITYQGGGAPAAMSWRTTPSCPRWAAAISAVPS